MHFGEISLVKEMRSNFLVFSCLFVSWFCRALGPMAAMEFVQCELWRGCKGACA